MAIVYVFAVECSLLILCMGPRVFCNPFLVLDFVVISTTIVIDTRMNNGRTPENNMLILIRLWRLAYRARNVRCPV